MKAHIEYQYRVSESDEMVELELIKWYGKGSDNKANTNQNPNVFLII